MSERIQHGVVVGHMDPQIELVLGIDSERDGRAPHNWEGEA